jgi:predicted esterase
VSGAGEAPAAGREPAFVHRFVPATAAGAPTLLLLHGTGGDETDLLPVGAMVWPGAAILSPRGRVLENGMPRFFRRLAEGVLDERDLEQRSAELAAFVRDSVARHGLRPGSVVAVGYSNGANIAASLLLTEPGLLAGAVLWRAMRPYAGDPPAPRTPAVASPVPVYLGAGLHDPYSRTAESLAELLRGRGAEVTLDWRDAGHGLERADVTSAAAWLARRFDPRG